MEARVSLGLSLSLVKGLSLNLELTDSATFAGQQWSVPFCLHPQHQAYRIAPLHTPAFFLGPRNLRLSGLYDNHLTH